MKHALDITTSLTVSWEGDRVCWSPRRLKRHDVFTEILRAKDRARERLASLEDAERAVLSGLVTMPGTEP